MFSALKALAYSDGGINARPPKLNYLFAAWLCGLWRPVSGKTSAPMLTLPKTELTNSWIEAHSCWSCCTQRLTNCCYQYWSLELRAKNQRNSTKR